MFWKNKTAITVLFLCMASMANILATSLLPRGGFARASSGGPVAPDIGRASVGEGIAVADGVRERAGGSAVLFHDALVSERGQSHAGDEASASAFVARLSLPARGVNWGELHPHNGVDVAGRCGSGVYASAPGQVALVRGGFAGGYGNYVDIDHGNGIVTRYAHNEKNLVAEGQMVAMGDTVALMGSTGNSTGCHVHFEVLGTSIRNPFSMQ